MEIKNAQEAVVIIREFAERSFNRLFWQEAKEVNFDSDKKEWRVVFSASPSLIAPYYDYEAAVDSQSGNVIRFKKLDKRL